MRVITKGIAAKDAGLAFEFEGRRIQTVPGASLGAALIAAGERICRRTPSGAPRGLFCGMGVCLDCLVTVDGEPNQRACMTAAVDGTTVERQQPLAAHHAPPREVSQRDESMDVLVIGAGPAGLAAASVASEAGLDVTLVDERAKLGGQYFKQPADGFTVDDELVDRQFRQGRSMIHRVHRSGVRLLSGVTVWAAHGPTEVRAVGNGVNYVLRPKRLVIATGAYDQAVPMPGWMLPGFMTTGAAQTLLRAYQVAPGNRVVISGNGPLNIQLAAELTRAGITVVALAELAPAPGLRSISRLATMFWTAPDLLFEGAGYLHTLRRAGVPMLYGQSVIAATGDGSVAEAMVATIDCDGRPMRGTERVLDADAVCIGFGFLPSNEISRALGCRHHFDERRRQLVVERDRYGRTTVDGVTVVGDGGGLGGARIALAQGTLAGVDAARHLRAGDTRTLALEASGAERELRRQERFQRALWELYRSPLLVDQLATDDTQICRCEEVSLGAIREAMDGGAESLGALKRITRAGMGRCQGRYCAGFIAGMLRARSGRPLDELEFFAPRAPFKPVPIGAVAPGRFADSAMAQRGYPPDES